MDPNADSVLTIEDFNACCRLCFSRNRVLENLFTSSQSGILEKIQNCLDISIVPEDSPATSVCQRCLMLVEQFHNYRQICQTYDQIFQSILKKSHSVLGENSRETDDFTRKIKIEPVDPADRIEQEPLEICQENIKEEPCSNDTVAEATDQDEDIEAVDASLCDMGVGSSASSSKKRKGRKRTVRGGITVRMVIDNNQMNCHRIYANGCMQWICCKSDCLVIYQSMPDGTFELRSNKRHNHEAQIKSIGLIQVLKSGRKERYALASSDVESVDLKLIWNEHEWNVSPLSKTGDRTGVCAESTKCRRYVKIIGNFDQLEDFGEHNHPKNFCLIRSEEAPTETDINLWELFCQIDPCHLSLSCEMELPIRLKLFYRGNQYRLAECFWDGSSKWRCDTVSCQILLSYSKFGVIAVKEHPHEAPIERQGVLNGIYYCVMATNIGLKRIFYNAHSFGSRSSGKWICAVPNCHARLLVGENYESFKMKGTHIHGGFGAIIQPLYKEAIYLSAKNPTLPAPVTIEDLNDILPASVTSVVPSSSAVVKAAPKEAKVSKEIKTQSNHCLESQSDESEITTVIRMVYDGHRYTFCEFFGDGTSYWRCWGQRCKKSIHMSPTGSLYSKNEVSEHNHLPTVSRIGQRPRDHGEHFDWFAVFEDATKNTIMMYKNTLWELVLGEGIYIATCKDFGSVGSDRIPCTAKMRISTDFSHFEQLGECLEHIEKILIVRSAAEVVAGDPMLWKMYQEKNPLYLSDGRLFCEGRNSHLFIGGYRYTLQSLLWNGSSVWRCALQFCTAKGRITSRGYFQTAEHKHEKPEHMQGTIWNQKRQKEERYIISITLKKTMATMYYNTYCYALRDTERNVWSCYPGLCNASLRIEGDFQRVVDEMEHTHDGTLTFFRKDETPESQETIPPTKGRSSRKRPREAAEQHVTPKLPRHQAEPLIISTSSPKLEGIRQILVKPTPIKSDVRYQQNQIVRYHNGFTYSRSSMQADGSIKLECNKFRCPGKVILYPDQSVVPKEDHSHSKSFDTYGTICDVITGENLTYILVNGTQKRNVTYFVCNGFRYHILTRSQNLATESEWQCGKCEVKISISNFFKRIEFSSSHTHEETDFIIPPESNESYTDGSRQITGGVKQLDEVVWGSHRYTTPIYIRRLNRTKWMCFKRKRCRAYLYQNTDGSFEDMEPHNHEGPVEIVGEARYDDLLKIKDRYAILKPGERPKVRQLLFQNHKYYDTVKGWVCIRKSCNGKIQANTDFDKLQILQGHSHQPIITMIKFQEEIQSCSVLPQ
ncbi:uncharacterized protein LOC131686786 [Topomyia yanbarensis]|uniref:uncharacterized protein LOC131686786 n=1 Tax=Topomyia yanbarensis TaxID=2498891 RepID=UPI00273AD60B|nr:uncharacterized protein LOC131686786 [Topomyia yanbarensis]